MDEPSFFDEGHMKITRPLSAPGSPRERSGMMTPGDFASLQEGREGLSTEDYIAWKLPEEEEEADYPFPLTLKQKKAADGLGFDGTSSGAVTPTGHATGGLNGSERVGAEAELEQARRVNGIGNGATSILPILPSRS
jgi:hypothetical protein